MLWQLEFRFFIKKFNVENRELRALLVNFKA